MPRRPVGLVVILALLAVGNLYGLTWGLTRAAALQGAYPRLAPPLWYLYLLCPVAGLASIVAVFRWRRWGLHALVALSILVFLIETYALGFGLHLARIPVALGLVLGFAWPVRRAFA